MNSIETDSSFISKRADRNAGFEIDRYIIENVCTKVDVWWRDKLWGMDCCWFYEMRWEGSGAEEYEKDKPSVINIYWTCAKELANVALQKQICATTKYKKRKIMREKKTLREKDR